MDATAIKAMMSEIAPVIREYVAAENAPLCARLASVERDNQALSSANEALEAQNKVWRGLIEELQGRVTGLRYTDKTITDLLPGHIETELAPVKAEHAGLLERLEALETRELVLPEKGDTGEPGPQGEPGPAGEVDMDAVKALLMEVLNEQAGQIFSQLAEIAPVEKGDPGEKGEKGDAGQDGKDGAPGEAGKDGIGLADALIDKDGQLVLTMTDGRTKALGLVVGKDGERGKDGKTFTLDDFDVEAIDERTIRLGFTGGAEKHTFELSFPVLIGRGIWAEAEDYERGDVVTWGGSAWEAVEPEKGVKPDLSSGGWRILAKRGRDGKAAK